MLMKVAFVLVFMLLVGAGTSAQEVKISAQDSTPRLVYSKNAVFTIAAPSGWVRDDVSGAKYGLAAVIYPKGSSWEQGESVMYVNSVTKDLKREETLATRIETDIQGFKADSPQVKVRDAGTLPTKTEKHEAVVKYFSGSKENNFEAVAYIDEKWSVVMLVLTCKSEKAFKDALPSFKELVASYSFHSAAIVLEPDK